MRRSMTGGLRRGLTVGLALAGIALLVLGVVALFLLLLDGRKVTLIGAFIALALAVGAIALSHAWGQATVHLRALERLRGAVLSLAGNPSAALPRLPEDEADAEVTRLHAALGELVARQAAARVLPDRRMEEVLAAVSEPIAVITEQGQVSLINAPARTLLGVERVRVGTSVFAALDRRSVAAALARAGAGPVTTEIASVKGERMVVRITALGEHGGAVLAFLVGVLEPHAELEHDLSLHDAPPPPLTLTDDTPLDALPVVVLDTETTGLDAAGDRVVSIGAVRLNGAHIYRSMTFDRLVNPGRPIPQRSTAVHGITDAMAADAAGFAAVYRELEPLLGGCVLVGHNVAFDLAILCQECERAGIARPDPPSLDVLLLAAALEVAPDVELESLAAAMGVDVRGRHTALGDALVTAEVYLRLLPRLADAGVSTLGQARALAAKAKHLVRRQKERGW